MEHPIFRDDGDQLTMITAILDTFPGQSGNPDVVVPIHPRVRMDWAKQLIKRGVVVVPELMQELPVSTGDHPEAGWLQPVVWVKAADYTTQQDATPQSTPEQQTVQARQMLEALDPDFAAKIAAMSDPEKRDELARMKVEIPKHIDALTVAQAQIAKAREKERSKEDNDG